MASGSADLNALLKARVVKIRVELDYKGSNLPSQVNAISTWLKDNNKAVKLKVEFNMSQTELNKQLKSLTDKIQTGKAIQPLKLEVQIDVTGSANKIKAQLRDVYKVVQDFNTQYGKQILQMQKTIQQFNPNPNQGGGNKKNNFGMPDPAQYVAGVREAEAELRRLNSTISNGLFSSTEIKNAKGDIVGFEASLKGLNGLVEKMRYEWDANKNTFTPISNTTVNKIEENVHKAHMALQMLQADITKLKDSSNKNNLQNEFNNLMGKVGNKTITQDMVMALQTQIREEQALQTNIGRSNNELLAQAKIVRQINNAMNALGKVDNVNKYNQLYSRMRTVLDDVFQNPSDGYKMQKEQLDKIIDDYRKEVQVQQEAIRNDNKRLGILRQTEELERKIASTDTHNKNLAEEIKNLTKVAITGKEWLNVNTKLSELKGNIGYNQNLQRTMELQNKVLDQTKRLYDLRHISESEYNSRTAQAVGFGQLNDIAELEKMYKNLARTIRQAEEEQKKLVNQGKVINYGKIDMKGMVHAQDTEALKRYFSELYRGKVQSVETKDRLDTLGRAVTELKVKMDGGGKTVQTYTLQMEHASNVLKQTATSSEYNANRNLGIFEQLGIAMARVPVWMVAMTAFYGTLNTVKEMTNQLLELDKVLTEIRRVANSNISIDYLFENAVQLSKELGNNTMDVLNSVSEMARTFGDFNERQLLAITRTATLMSNVSDLSAQEATQDLIGTMNAFNISAEESIHIVDALNEVDNNYAVSTKQLADGMARSASTAVTFGLSMEQLAGAITAIGSVTMESGQVIGNSLKSIISRVTTVDKAKESLQSVGVAIEDTTGKVRPVYNILGDLASRWNQLNDSQRQNIAVNVAGRYQLSRFLAWMGNWETQIKATDTAVNSQGSALRENAKYMASFEARLNQLKNGFTELSKAVGDSILSNGLLLVIESLKSFAEVGVSVAKNFGALPAILIPVVAILGKFGVLDSIALSIARLALIPAKLANLKAIFSEIGAMPRQMQTAYRATMVMTDFQTTRTQALAGAWREVTVAEAGATVGGRLFGTVLKSALITTGIGAVIVALGFAIEKIADHFAKAKEKEEELQKTQDKMITSYRQHRDGMDGMIQRYDELSKKQIKSKSEEEELAKLQKDFANQIPTTVAYVDANGKAHLKSADSIKREVESVKQLSLEKAKLDEAKFTDNLNKQADSYQKIVDKIDELNTKQKELNDANGKAKTVFGITYDDGDNTKEIQKNKIDLLMAESEKTEAIKKTIKTLQSQSLAYLEAHNMFENLTDKQQSVVESFIGQNESILRYAKDFKQASVGLYQVGNSIGTIFSDAMDIYKNSLKDISDKNPLKAMKIEEFKKQLDGVAKSIPDYFYQLSDGYGRPIKSVNELQNGLKEIINVSHLVGKSSVEDTDKLIYRLERAGLTAEDAQAYLFRFAQQENNTAIKAELATRGIDGTTDSLQDLNQETLKAIDNMDTLFGYNDDDLKGINQRLKAMKAMVQIQGESAKKTPKYLQDAQEVADKLGMTVDEVIKNEDKLYKNSGTALKVNLDDWKPEEKTFDQWIDSLEDLKPNEKEFLKSYNGLHDIVTGEVKRTAQDVQKPAEEIKDTIQNIFNDIQLKLPEIDLTNEKGSIFYVEDDINKLQQKLKDLGVDINMPTGDKAMDTLIGHLEMADGKVADTKENMLILRGIIQAGIGSGFFNNLITDADTTDAKVLGINKDIENTPQAKPDALKPVGDSADNNAPKVENISQKVKEAFNPQGYLQSDVFKPVGDSASRNTDPISILNKAVNSTFEFDESKFSKYSELLKKFGDGKISAQELHDSIVKIFNPDDLTLGRFEVAIKGVFDELSVDSGNGSEDVKQIWKNTIDWLTSDMNLTNQNNDKFKQNLATPPVPDGKWRQIYDPYNEAVGNAQQGTDNLNTSIEKIGQTYNEVFNGQASGSGEFKVFEEWQAKQQKMKEMQENIKKMQDLGTAITKAGDSQKLLSQMNDNLSQVNQNAGTVKGSLDTVYAGIDSINSQTGTISNVTTNVGNAVNGITTIQNQIGGVFSSIDTGSQTLLNSITNVQNAMSAISQAVQGAIGVADNLHNSLVGVANVDFGNVTNLGQYYAQLASGIYLCIQAIEKSVGEYNATLQGMEQQTQNSISNIINIFAIQSPFVTSYGTSMANDMYNNFVSGTQKLITYAGSLPSAIGQGIRNAMNDSSSAISDLAKDMVKRFKDELGIHSPSKVFKDLGLNVIQGLEHGLSGNDLKSLGKSVFKDFGGGIFDSWDMIKAYLTDDFGNVTGGSAQSWASVATKALLMTNQYSPENLQRLLMQMQTESGGNPQAINLWDSNAKNGIPSKGLMQVIDPTFKSYAMQGFDKNIYDPLSNILASIRYALARYGSLSKAYQGHGYATGGIIDKMELAWHGEDGAEAIIPLTSKYRKRGLELWGETGQRLGIDPRMLKWLERFLSKQGGGTATNGRGSFGTSSGTDGGTSSGGDTGASGTIVGSYNLDGGYDFMALAGFTDYSQRSGNIFDSYAPENVDNFYQKNITYMANQIQQLQSNADAMNKSTQEYRETLKQIIALENSRQQKLAEEKGWLQTRNNALNDIISKMPALSQLNDDQKQTYQTLTQEFDSNYTKLQEIDGELQTISETVKKQSVEVFTDFIDQVVNMYDDAIKTIQTKIDNTDFTINVLKATNPDNMKDLLNNQVTKANQLQQEQATAYNKQNELQSQYNSAVNWYGANSDQAKKVKDALTQATKDYQQYTLDVISAENDIKDTRGKIADDGISKLKDYYGKMKDMATSAIDKEKEQLQKEHDEKMKMYDDEEKAINDIYDARSKAMDKANAEEDYNSEMADKNAKKAELVNKIALASRDTSLEGKKRLADLQQQLTDLNKEISDAQTQHQRDLMKQALDDQKQAQLDAIEANKTTVDATFQNQSDALDAQKDEVTKQYDDIINNEQRWADVRNQAIDGNFTTINDEITKMADNINLMSQGIFDNLFNGFSTFSNIVKSQIASNYGMDISNLGYETSGTVSAVNQASGSDNYTYTNGTVDSSKGEMFNTQLVTAPPPPPPPPPVVYPPPPPPAPQPRYHTIVKGDTMWDLAQQYYGNPYKWTIISQANGNPNPYTLQIGSRLLIPYKSGGYTGDDVPESGALAILHKKELVLNQAQTENILDTAKIMDRIKGFVANIKTSNIFDKLATASTINNTITYGDFIVTVENGDKKKATDIAKEIMKEFKKKGK